MLGCAIGSKSQWAAFTAGLVSKTNNIFKELGGDPQIATRLLRNCAASSKLAYAVRWTPAGAQCQQLADFDSKVRGCSSKATGVLPEDNQWLQAALRFEQAGLGLRSCAKHAPTTYLASVTSTEAWFKDLDSSYDLEAGACAHAAKTLVLLKEQLSGDSQHSFAALADLGTKP